MNLSTLLSFSPFISKSVSGPHCRHPLIQGFSSGQLAMVESTTVMIEEREKEIKSIVQSIAEINEMYRDLATLIVDQVIIHTHIHTDLYLNVSISTCSNHLKAFTIYNTPKVVE